MSDTPTPETEKWQGWGVGGLEVVPAFFARELERRLTVAREALAKIAHSPMTRLRVDEIAELALTQTAPKQ